MKPALLELLCCPACSSSLSVIDGSALRCYGCERSYPVTNGIPRFVGADNYASNFGFQWNRFSRTQLDSHTGVPISRDRFLRFTGWTANDLDGKTVLDVGCGAGRFTEIALALGARVVAVDYSAAVDACAANLMPSPRLDIVQADIYALPFRPNTFDFVYCLGVLQHTPDVEKSFHSLYRSLKPGGRIAVDVYPKMFVNLFWSKYWIRPITKRVDQSRLFGIVERFTPFLLSVSRAIARIPIAGRKLKYAIPVVNYEGVYPLSEEQLKEWAVLDTFDMLAPAHDQPQSQASVEKWFRDAPLKNASVERIGFIVGRGEKV